MKAILFIVLGCILMAAQTAVAPKTTILPNTTMVASSGGIVVTSGWKFLQGTSGTVTANSGAFWLQNSCGASPTNFCTIALGPTTAGSDMVFGLITVPTDTQTITSAFTCASLTGGKCTVGNAIDTCTTGAFAHTSTNDHTDACYVANSAGGANFVTENWSGTPANNNTFAEMEEILPPLCNGVRCTSSFDTNVYNFSNSTCAGGCTGSSMGITATDGIIGIYDSAGNPPDGFAAVYQNDFVGNMFALDATSAPAYTVTGPTWYTLNQFAFKSQGAAYSPTGPIFTWANASTTGTLLPSRNTTVSCAPTCVLTLFNTTGTGRLGMLVGIAIGGAGYISSVTNAGTWVVPTAANTCREPSATSSVLSCAYNLSTTSGATTLSVTVTVNGNYQFAYFEISRSSGSFLLDSQNSSFNGSSSATISGQALTITGPDACFQAWGMTGSTFETIQTYYPQPRDANQWQVTGALGSVGMLLDAPNGTPTTTVYLQGTAPTSGSIGICFK